MERVPKRPRGRPSTVAAIAHAALLASGAFAAVVPLGDDDASNEDLLAGHAGGTEERQARDVDRFAMATGLVEC